MNGFQQVLDHICAVAEHELQKGHLFERLMKSYFQQDPIYIDRFSSVWLWREWAMMQPEFDALDTGIDLVAQERTGGYCAIQCKCYGPDTHLSKRHIDSFISDSAREPYTARLLIDTGGGWGPNAKRAIDGLTPPCQVLRFDDLASRPFNWPDLVNEEPESLSYVADPFQLRPHQQEALDKVLDGFREFGRGKLIMACGTGKTFVSLRIAEAIAELGGRVLYLVPSISLLQQAMREWAEQREIAHRYIGICSDTRAGRDDEDANMNELEIPVTTKPDAISDALRTVCNDKLTVVFCTYQSLPLVEQAQRLGAPEFDIALCDEAHRTTGIERPGDSTSPFVLVHDNEKVRSKKRLYMTATPRLFTASAKSKAADHDVDVFSMDDPSTFGKEFYRIPFSEAIKQNLLCDYKVVVLGISEDEVDRALQAHIASRDSEVNISDAAKIVGCWQALQNPEHKQANSLNQHRLRRAIAFVNTIRNSKRLEKYWDEIIREASNEQSDKSALKNFRCEIKHVDGKTNALDRRRNIDWLKGDAAERCRILTNARCLSEGIDVPALDAILFLESRSSHVDIVQAVGRVMRKSPGKQYGYIILPIAVPAGIDAVSALNDNKTYAVVWEVLRALRSHDDRFNAEINQIDLNRKPPQRIIFHTSGSHNNESGNAAREQNHPTLPFPPIDLPPGAIFAKIVEKCGDRKYWENWADDVADIFRRVVQRIGNLLENPDNAALQEWFEAFHKELKSSINDSITKESAIDMMAQHILTRPVFESLFESYDFAGNNPVSQALDSLRSDFREFGLENETRDLEKFYESVRLRAQGLDNSEARQRVLMELYEKFFSTAMKKDADRLGIVYTPVEIVDFILASANHILQSEFGRSLSDEGVHILDPFTGTGIFIVRLLQSGLIDQDSLARKYREELHANEIVLLAYYIAAIHIEEAYHGRQAEVSEYEPFGGIVLTDTFNLHTDRSTFPKVWMPANSERAERQQDLPIQVIVGNPPWSVGQRSSSDDNPNVEYPELRRRIGETYASRSTVTNRNSLYDTYKMAIRWATDRISDRGIIALVTNGSWIDGNADSGIRACFAEEFDLIYVLNLRGNARTSGVQRRAEGDNVFGQGSRAPVAITLLIKKPSMPESTPPPLAHVAFSIEKLATI